MKKVSRLAFLITVLITGLITKPSFATHVMGMDIAWKCMGNDTFQITLVIYRRCTDGAAGLSVPVPVITSDSCANAYTVNPGTNKSYTIEDVTPLCATQQKLCPSAGGTGQSNALIPFGVEKHTVIYNVYLGGNYANCCWYKIRYQLCCRNNNITTGYALADFYSDSWLNRCISPCNNGPEFKNPPILIRCAGQDVLFNHGAIEADGDSLSYAMVAPLGGSYKAPWSYTYPLECEGGNNPNPNAIPPTGFNLNPLNGDIYFRPVQVQITVLKIMVSEWRKDMNGNYKIIGKTARDIQFAIVQNCNNKLPLLSAPYSYKACAGQQLCIPVNSHDSDQMDSTRIYWNGGIKGGIWVNNNGSVKNASGNMCWTPDLKDTSNLPYYFTVTALDNHCPLNGNATRSFSIIVSPSPPKPQLSKINNTLISSPAFSYQWYDDTTLINGAVSQTFNPSKTGSYKVKNTNINGCSTFSDFYGYTAGIKINSWTTKIKISPNPFHDQLILEITDLKKPVIIILYDMQGKLILEEKNVLKATVKLNTSNLSTGMYLLEITDGENKASYKVEKQ